ncbi:GIY-YIG nuclease family protein [Desertivirga brevis]|uniref:GIY-YIG nuclease family protein n=3 Tax=Desertivirga brevis TaxID=2810310 RepID=UPI001F60529E|nr:GIY-YIG nuclease family protein [Pedobacter sp. SYSU D00873]
MRLFLFWPYPDMYIVYILYSSSLNKYYIGSTSNLPERLRKHNTKHKGFTGGPSDWEVAFMEKYERKEDALKREKQIKAWKSRIMIERLISSAGS